MIRLRDIPDDGDDEATSSPDVRLSPSHAEPSTPRQRKPRGIPTAPAAQTDELSYLNPAQVAAMWGISHDKVLEFIKDGELVAFNVASKTSRRPRYKISMAAVKAFEEQRSGCDPTRSAPVSSHGRARQKNDQAPPRQFF